MQMRPENLQDIPPTPDEITETFAAARTMALGAAPPEDVAEALATLWILIHSIPDPERARAKNAAARGAANPTLLDPTQQIQPDPLNPAPQHKAGHYSRHIFLLISDAPTAPQPGPRDHQSGALLWRRIAAAMAASESHMDDYAHHTYRHPPENESPRIRWTQTPGENEGVLRHISSYLTDPEAVTAHASAIIKHRDEAAYQTLADATIETDETEAGLLYHTAVNARMLAEADLRSVTALLIPPHQDSQLSWRLVADKLETIDYAKGLEAHSLAGAAKIIQQAAPVRPSRTPQERTQSPLTRLRRLIGI